MRTQVHRERRSEALSPTPEAGRPGAGRVGRAQASGADPAATQRMLDESEKAAGESLSGDSDRFLARNRQRGGE